MAYCDEVEKNLKKNGFIGKIINIKNFNKIIYLK